MYIFNLYVYQYCFQLCFKLYLYIQFFISNMFCFHFRQHLIFYTVYIAFAFCPKIMYNYTHIYIYTIVICLHKDSTKNKCVKMLQEILVYLHLTYDYHLHR